LSRNGPVLVTGGSGFIGLAAVRALLAAGHQVIATTTRPQTPPLDAPGLQWVGWDAEAQPLPVVDWEAVSAICHLAVPRRLGPFPEQAGALFAVNIAATFALLEAARRHGVPRVVLASTGDVVAPADELAEAGDRHFQPRNFYGTSKACLELLAQGYEGLLGLAVLRIYHPYGPEAEAGRFVVNRLIRKVEAGEEITMEGPDGILINPLWVDDLGAALVQAVRSESCGTFNLAGPDLVRLREMLELAAALCGRPARLRSLDVAPDPRHAGRIEASGKALDWVPKVGLRDGLTRLLAESGSRG
jgi:UDP-glucose 4-epimerase